MGLRPADQQALHAQDGAPDAGGSRRVRGLLPAGGSAQPDGDVVASEASPDGRWRDYSYEELLARDKVSLDLTWLRDESLEDSANLPEPHVLAQEIADDLQAALEQMRSVLGDLEERVVISRGPAPEEAT